MTARSPIGFTARPPGLSENGASRIVRGHSMGAMTHGSLVFYNADGSMPNASLIGELVVAAVKGQTDAPFVRFLDVGSRRGTYTLRSVTGPLLVDVELEWAAAVIWIRLPSMNRRPNFSMFEDETEYHEQDR